jgi:hypothetical protein
VRRDIEIYAATLHRLAGGDHGWGKPYDFAAWYILDHAVPGVEQPGAEQQESTPEDWFDDALQATLRAQVADLPDLTFVRSIDEVYDSQRPGPNQIRNGGAFVALGPILGDSQTTQIGVMFYAGHRWARWMRYHLERVDGVWCVTGREELAVS